MTQIHSSQLIMGHLQLILQECPHTLLLGLFYCGCEMFWPLCVAVGSLGLCACLCEVCVGAA